jgi:alkylation response protein AidB-like acyl-CoA dehydrogenase
MALTNTDMRPPLDLAVELAPLIRSYADEIEEGRELPRPLFETLADAGMFRLLVPRSLGGRELDLPTYIQVIETLGRADASTGWVINQGGVWATYSARMPLKTARKIWVETPRAVVANTPAPESTASVVDGGYRVTGRCGFSTGCRHASWLAPHARVVENGQPRMLPNGNPEARFLFVPVDEAERLDTWQVRGMRGTGTHHFAVHDVFVPAERSVLVADAPLREPGPLYVFPRTLLFASGDAAVALGLARSCIEVFVELAGGKHPRGMNGLLRDQALTQSEVGHAEADLRSARALLRETAGEIWDAVSASGEITLDQRVALRIAATHAIRLAVRVVDTVYNISGATAVYQSHPLQRYFQDIHVISQHTQARLNHYELVGRYYLGLEIGLDRL